MYSVYGGHEPPSLRNLTHNLPILRLVVTISNAAKKITSRKETKSKKMGKICSTTRKTEKDNLKFCGII